MTIKELITQLQQYDLDMQVLLDGYEMGYDPIKEVKVETVIPNPADEECWGGQYLDSEDRELQIQPLWGDPIPIQDNEGEMYFNGVQIAGEGNSPSWGALIRSNTEQQGSSCTP